MRVYLVGGAVRDWLLYRPVTDKDHVVLDADRQTLLRRMPRLKQVGGGLGQGVEAVFIHNNEQYTLSTAASIEEDLHTRDLTINALAVDVQAPQKIIAHPEALQDLEQRLLRPVRIDNFADDPCRTIRAARFAAVLPGFAPVPELFGAMRLGREKGLEVMAPERIGHEVRKACAGMAPARFLSLLARSGCLAPWFLPFVGKTNLRKSAQQLMQRLAGRPALWCFMAMCHYLQADEAHALAAGLRLPKVWQQAGVDASLLLPRIREYNSLDKDEKIQLLLHCHQRRLLDPLQLLAMQRYGKEMEAVSARMELDSRRILDVRLPSEYRNRGTVSARKLRQLRRGVLSGGESF